MGPFLPMMFTNLEDYRPDRDDQARLSTFRFVGVDPGSSEVFPRYRGRYRIHFAEKRAEDVYAHVHLDPQPQIDFRRLISIWEEGCQAVDFDRVKANELHRLQTLEQATPLPPPNNTGLYGDTSSKEKFIRRAGMEVFIGVPGWMTDDYSFIKDLSQVSELHPGAETYALEWQTSEL